VVEGSTTLFPPATNLNPPSVRPGAREKGQPFYNPGMALNRDLSVLLVEAFAKGKGREIDVADALAGTGARSLRVAREVEAPLVVHANDRDAAAVKAMKRGLAANGIDPARLLAREGDAYLFLAERRFDVVDLDPCGSPMPFLDAAVRATRHDGLVCATATDTGALAGTFPRVCRRRYGAEHGLHKAPWRLEVGLRILAGALVRSAARFDRVAIPVLSVSSGHWMRVVARMGDGLGGADAALKRLRNAAVDPATTGGRFLPPHGTDLAGWAGPLWSGPLHDAALLSGMEKAMEGKTLAHGRKAEGLLALLLQEAEAPPFWVVPERLLRALGQPEPRRDAFIGRLCDAGFTATRTHLDPQGVRTDAGLAGLTSAWRA
jgi:tRNA (guanine26-N2/guanine27-N2)-dimethyltransferase